MPALPLRDVLLQSAQRDEKSEDNNDGSMIRHVRWGVIFLINEEPNQGLVRSSCKKTTIAMNYQDYLHFLATPNFPAVSPDFALDHEVKRP